METSQLPASFLVAIVDDDESVRSAVEGVLKSVGFRAQTFTSAEAFLAAGLESEARCLITDLQMPGMNGLELQAKLSQSNWAIPVIFITAFGEPQMRERAVKAGAVGFLDKPFDDNKLIAAVRTALNI